MPANPDLAIQDTGVLLAASCPLAPTAPAADDSWKTEWTDRLSQTYIMMVCLEAKTNAYRLRIANTVRNAIAAGVPIMDVAGAIGATTDQVSELAALAAKHGPVPTGTNLPNTAPHQPRRGWPNDDLPTAAIRKAA